jgi:methionyl-tRNA synthetase
LSLGLGLQNVSFQPKPLNPKADKRAGDPVMKEGNLISNVLNRAVRTCFYTMQNHFGGRIPAGEVSADIREAAESVILAYEKYMYLHQFHTVIETVDKYIRGITKHWAEKGRKSSDGEIDPQAFIDSFHMVRVATALMHPIAPHGTEMVREYLNLGEEFWNWDRIFDSLYDFMDDPEKHEFKVLEPRVDFFEKHPSQIRRS